MRLCALATAFFPFAAMACSAGPSSDDGDSPDLGTETDSAGSAFNLKAIAPLSLNTRVIAALGSTGTYGYRFHGSPGQRVSIYADAATAPSVLDTVLYLYKVSRLSGLPYGRALAKNDNTAGAWSRNAHSSSIDNFALPEERDYAIVVARRGSASGNAAVWWTTALIPPVHTGTVGVSEFTLQFTGRFLANDPGPYRWIELHRDGTYTAARATTNQSGTYRAVKDQQIPLPIEFKPATGSTISASVSGYDGILSVGAQTLTLVCPILADEDLCGDTDGTWLDDESNSEGLYCACSSNAYFIPSEGGCVK